MWPVDVSVCDKTVGGPGHTGFAATVAGLLLGGLSALAAYVARITAVEALERISGRPSWSEEDLRLGCRAWGNREPGERCLRLSGLSAECRQLGDRRGELTVEAATATGCRSRRLEFHLDDERLD